MFTNLVLFTVETHTIDTTRTFTCRGKKKKIRENFKIQKKTPGTKKK